MADIFVKMTALIIWIFLHYIGCFPLGVSSATKHVTVKLYL